MPAQQLIHRAKKTGKIGEATGAKACETKSKQSLELQALKSQTLALRFAWPGEGEEEGEAASSHICGHAVLIVFAY